MSEATDAIDEAEPENDARRKLTKDAITGTVTGYVVEPSTGEKLEAEFKDITGEERQELQELERQADSLKNLDESDLESMDEAELEELVAEAEAAESKFETRVIDDYLLNDEFTAENTGQAMKSSILVGFLRAIGADNEAIREAETFFEDRLDRGNR